MHNLSICIPAHLHIRTSITIFVHTHINMSLSDFFTPVDLTQIIPKNGYYTSHLGSKIDHYSVNFPDLEETNIALIGVQEDRNAVNNPGCALGPDYVREKLYQLNEGAYTTKIADLGNIRQGRNSDRYLHRA